jgi:hypothetical protein
MGPCVCRTVNGILGWSQSHDLVDQRASATGLGPRRSRPENRSSRRHHAFSQSGYAKKTSRVELDKALAMLPQRQRMGVQLRF